MGLVVMEIHWSIVHWINCTGSHVGSVYRCVSVSIHIEQIICNQIISITRKVEIWVITHINHRFWSVVASKLISMALSSVSLKVTLAVTLPGNSDLHQEKNVSFQQSLYRSDLPLENLILPSFRSTIKQCPEEVVLRQLNSISIDNNSTLVNPICITSDSGSEILGTLM